MYPVCHYSTWFNTRRVGQIQTVLVGPTNHLLSDNLSTEIGASDKGMNALTQNLKRTLAQGSNPDRSLTTGFKRIAKLCDNLGLVRGIYDRACELFKKVTEGQMVKGRSASSIIPAVVFLACRHEQMPSECLWLRKPQNTESWSS